MFLIVVQTRRSDFLDVAYRESTFVIADADRTHPE